MLEVAGSNPAGPTNHDFITRYQHPQIQYKKKNDVFPKKRIILFFIFVGLFSLTFQLGTFFEVSEEEAQIFMDEFEELIKNIDAIGIFVHNTALALPMFIPGFGIGFGFFSSWSTGYAFSAITTLNPELSEVPPLTILYLSPFGLMELTAYAIGMSRSFILIQKVVKKIPLKLDTKVTLIEIGIVVGLLLVAGIIEDYMIKLVQEGELSFV